jgi:hypothetical protein
MLHLGALSTSEVSDAAFDRGADTGQGIDAAVWAVESFPRRFASKVMCCSRTGTLEVCPAPATACRSTTWDELAVADGPGCRPDGDRR